MAITRVRTIGSNSDPAVGVASLAIPVTASIAVGNLIVVGLAGARAATPTVTIADTGGNVYQQDRVDKNTGSNNLQYIFSAKVTTGLVNGNSITITITGGLNQAGAAAYEYTGQAQSGWLDQATGAQGNSVNPSSGALTPSQNNCLLFGCIGYSTTPAFTATGSWALLDNLLVTSNSLGTEEQFQAVAASVAATGTLGASVNWAHGLAIYLPAPDAVAGFPGSHRIRSRATSW